MLGIDCKGREYNDFPLGHCKNIIGQRFNRLVVLKRVMPIKNVRPVTYWLCKCDCGNEVISVGVDLTRGHAQSCGCYNRDINLNRSSIHEGDTIRGFKFIKRDLTRKNYSRQYYWKVQCPYCNKIYSVDPNCILNGTVMSCGCLNLSKGEKIIHDLLLANSINFKMQITFPDLISVRKGSLRFDFGVHDEMNHLLYLIEYDGEQHFIKKPNRFGGYDQFDITKENDNQKNEYCKKHSIPLIRIPYTKLNQLNLEMLDPKTSQFLLP